MLTQPQGQYLVVIILIVNIIKFRKGIMHDVSFYSNEIILTLLVVVFKTITS